MSLQVWLPLNGNLNNQGLSNVNLTSKNTGINDKGKIGKCYEFIRSNSSSIVTDYEWRPSTEWSVCFWVYRTEDMQGNIFRNSTKYSPIVDFNHQSSTGEWNTRFFYWINANEYYMMTSEAIRLNRWYHVCYCSDGVSHKYYINGVLGGSSPITRPMPYSSGTLVLGGQETSSSNMSFQFPSMLLNDFRVYDHCLSSKEIKEISKGLILHYPLNQPERSINLLPKSKTFYITSAINRGWHLYMGNKWTIEEENGEKVAHCVQSGVTSNTWQMLMPTRTALSTVEAQKYEYITFSFYIKTSNPSSLIADGNCLVYYNGYIESGERTAWNGVPYGSGNTNFIWVKAPALVKDQWSHTIVKIKTSIADSHSSGTKNPTYIQIGFGSQRNFDYYVKLPKLELGTNENPQWSPNPEDEDNWGLTEYDISGFGNHASAEYYVNENMIFNSTFSNGTTRWAGVNGSIISLTTIDGRKCITATKGTSGYLYCTNSNITYTKGTSRKCWFSAEIYSSVEQTIQAGSWVTNDSGNWISTGYFAFTNSNLKVGWNNVSAYVTLYNTDYGGRVIFAVGCSGGDNIQMYHPKLEEYNLTEYTVNSTEAEFKKPLPNISWSNNSPRYNGSYTFADSCTRAICRPTLKFINNPGFTFSCWAYPTSYERTNIGTKSANVQFIMSQGREWYESTSTNYYGCSIVMNGTSKNMAVYIAKSYIDSGVSLSLNTWYHLCITYDGTNLKQYVNGVLKKTTAIDSSLINWGNAPGFVIGKMAYGYSGATSFHPFVGNISDARVYVTALSDSDVKELYDSPISIAKDGTLMIQGEVIEQ